MKHANIKRIFMQNSFPYLFVTESSFKDLRVAPEQPERWRHFPFQNSKWCFYLGLSWLEDKSVLLRF